MAQYLEGFYEAQDGDLFYLTIGHTKVLKSNEFITVLNNRLDPNGYFKELTEEEFKNALADQLMEALQYPAIALLRLAGYEHLSDLFTDVEIEQLLEVL